MTRPNLFHDSALWLLGVLLLCGCAPGAASTAEQAHVETPSVVASANSQDASSPSKTGQRAAKPQESKQQSKQAKKPSSAQEPLRANNLVQLRERVGQSVTVVGRVSDVRKTSSGRRFVNFAGGLAATCDGDDYGKFAKDNPLEKFAGKDVQLSGLLKLHNGKLQVQLTEPRQVRLASSAPTTKPAPKDLLKSIGKDRWLSPIGLQYVGRDPQGRTRVEHIMRHAKDDPNRSGPHGVFDQGEQSEVFALIDEAWRLAEKRKLRPKVEGARSVYTVTFPKRIGFLGGQTGKRKRHPPLKQMLIVFESGTKQIVTAYPK